MKRNGWQEPVTPVQSYSNAKEDDTTDHECDANQIIIGYIPAIFYSNMFSLAFLEIKSLTKISDTKSTKDWKIGITVVGVILLSYLCIYIVLFSGNAAIETETPDGETVPNAMLKQSFLVGAYNMFVMMPNPFMTTKSSDDGALYNDRTQMNYFDLYYIVTSIMLLCQAVVYLQIARENLIIFIEEHIN